MIQIQGLTLRIGENTVFQNISFSVKSGEIVYLMGKNGSGKSSIAKSILGLPGYQNNDGNILLENEDITQIPSYERSRKGIFLALQQIPEIPGVPLGEFLRTIYNIHKKEKDPNFREISPFVFKRFIQAFLKKLELSPDFLERDLFVSFSGGEKRKIELLQILLLEPKYIILDEIDSGVDINSLKIVLKTLEELHLQGIGMIIITHNPMVAETLLPDTVIILNSGSIAEIGGQELFDKIREYGF